MTREKRYELFSWGLKNNILISAEAVPTKGKHWATPDVRLVYNIRGKSSLSKQLFEQDTKAKREEITNKIYEAYEFYKNKYGDSSN